MTDLEGFTQLPPDFDSCVRLFPLPDLVVFPQAMQPLHIFEPRYCEMLEDALAGDGLIATATLAPGWETSDKVASQIDAHICICRIISHSSTDDDRHNIFMIGLRRARVIEELETGRPFRMARVETLEDVYPLEGAAHRSRLKVELLDAFRRLIPDVAEVQKNLHELMASQMQLGAVTDIIGFTLQLDTLDKLRLLGQPDVDQRANHLLHLLSQREQETGAPPWLTHPRRVPFPPPFSSN